MLHAWERQPWDTEESWALFVAYRDQTRPRRGLRLLIAGRLADPLRIHWYHENHYWSQRIAEYDRHLDGVMVEERRNILRHSAKDITTDWLTISADGRDILMREFRKHLDAVKVTVGDTVPLKELRALAETIHKIDRLETNQSTSNVEVSDETNFDDFTDEELERYIELKKKSERKKDDDAPRVH